VLIVEAPGNLTRNCLVYENSFLQDFRVKSFGAFKILGIPRSYMVDVITWSVTKDSVTKSVKSLVAKFLEMASDGFMMVPCVCLFLFIFRKSLNTMT